VNCPVCKNDITSNSIFCSRCWAFVPKQHIGEKAALLIRLFATALDSFFVLTWGFISTIATFSIFYIMALILKSDVSFILKRNENAFIGVFGLFMIAYGVFFLWLLRRGITPGKKVLNLQVVKKSNGDYAGFWTMLLREIIGKFTSALFLGLGYFWAIWDRDSQAWHDKIAGTVVVLKSKDRSDLAVQDDNDLVDGDSNNEIQTMDDISQEGTEDLFCYHCGEVIFQKEQLAPGEISYCPKCKKAL